MNKKLQRIITLALVITVTSVAFPNFALAQYQPRTESEMIAYLYGQIAILLTIQQMIDRGGALDAGESVFNYVSVDTHKATEVEETTAYLRGEVNLFGEATASAWFEYGQDEDFLDQRTSKVSVRSAYDRAVRTQVRNLEDDERYYFRIAAVDKGGLVQYGEVYGFRTDESDD